MVVDDSIVVRSVFENIIQPYPEFAVAAAASSAEQALTLLDRTDVDVILLDITMPGTDGLTALPEIVRRSKGARVVVVSASVQAGQEQAVRVLQRGAVATLAKPHSGNFGASFRSELIETLRRVSASIPPVTRDPVVRAAPAPTCTVRAPVAGPIEVIAVGASTGGLHALTGLFTALPASCTAPILITQHLPVSFMPYFAEQISQVVRRRATVARSGDVLRERSVLIAPGDAHLGLFRSGDGVRVELDHSPAPSGCQPSVDPMLFATARLFGARAFAVILTGMGRDGALGAQRLVDAGGEIAVQDHESSVVWGMPGAVASAGLATTIGRPAALAGRIAERLGIRPALRSDRP